MKNVCLSVLSILIVFLLQLQGYCGSDVIVYNLKVNNLYLLDMDGKTEDIEISNEDMMKIEPLTTITNDSKQLVIDTFKTGICDVSVKTENDSYKIRFITGSVFDEETDKLTRIDMPYVLSGEKQ